MKAVIQRVRNAAVKVDGNVSGSIGRGLLVYLGVARDDTEKDADWMADKTANLRIFEDAGGKMNLSLLDIQAEEAGVGSVAPRTASAAGAAGETPRDESVSPAGAGRAAACEEGAPRAPLGVLAVSQFTLLGDAVKGRRPYYGNAAEPEKAKALYEYFMGKIKEYGLACEAGVFQAHMDVSYTNDGPVTILLDSALS